MAVWVGDNQAELFRALERENCRIARIIFVLPSDMPSEEILATAK